VWFLTQSFVVIDFNCWWITSTLWLASYKFKDVTTSSVAEDVIVFDNVRNGNLYAHAGNLYAHASWNILTQTLTSNDNFSVLCGTGIARFRYAISRRIWSHWWWIFGSCFPFSRHYWIRLWPVLFSDHLILSSYDGRVRQCFRIHFDNSASSRGSRNTGVFCAVAKFLSFFRNQILELIILFGVSSFHVDHLLHTYFTIFHFLHLFSFQGLFFFLY